MSIEIEHPAQPLKLLLVVDSLDVGGAERYVADLGASLRREGHQVTVAASADGSLSGILKREGVPFLPLMNRVVKRQVSLPYVWRLRSLLKVERFDLVHAHIYASQAAASLATLGSNTPLIITEHTEGSWKTRRSHLLSKWVYHRATHLIAVSRPIRDLLIHRYAVDPAVVTYIPNAVTPSLDDSLSKVTPRSGSKVEPLVGVVARLQPEKGLTYFLEAAKEVRTLIPEVRFRIIGDGPLRRSLESYARQLGIQDAVEFMGFRPDARSLIAELDVLALPSLTEGTPLSLLEAMAEGVPVVASNVGGIPDQISHNREGLLVPAADPATLSAAMLNLLQNPARARALGLAGRRRALSESNYATMLGRIEDVYRMAMGSTELVRPSPRRLPLRPAR